MSNRKMDACNRFLVSKKPALVYQHAYIDEMGDFHFFAKFSHGPKIIFPTFLSLITFRGVYMDQKELAYKVITVK